MRPGRSPKILVQVVVICLFDVYRESVKYSYAGYTYAKASYVLRPLSRYV